MELAFLQAIQSAAHPVLDRLFILVTMMGEPIFLLMIFCWIYWNIDREKGLSIAYSVFTTLLLGNGLKDVFKAARPIGMEGVRSLRTETATGWSFPSGHSLSASSAATAFSLQFPSIKVWCVSVLVMLLVGFSRMYLGLHWPRDVIGGLLLGAVCSLVCCQLNRILASRLVLYGGTFLLLVPFAFFAQSPDFYKALGLYAGFLLGALFEERCVSLQPAGALSRKVLRYILGLAILAAVEVAGTMLLPQGTVMQMLHYGVLGFVAVGLCPWLFRWMRA